ncbi:hypothetical protein DFH06DRAFT_1133583 [Mycena polygramma]|nr:hypothetical protein DFH06DRAFT_1133583 [Mycena polygramma]
MAPFLAGFRSSNDIRPGPARVTTNREIVHRYQDSRTGQPLKTVIVGILKAKIDRKHARSIFVLESPGPSSLILRDMFKKQIKLLEELMLPEGPDNTTTSGVRGRRSFTQGVYSCEYLQERTLPESPLSIIASEVPTLRDRPRSLIAGSLVVCYAALLKVDMPVFQSSATEPVFSRGYGIHAVRIVQLFKSDSWSQSQGVPRRMMSMENETCRDNKQRDGGMREPNNRHSFHLE